MFNKKHISLTPLMLFTTTLFGADKTTTGLLSLPHEVTTQHIVQRLDNHSVLQLRHACTTLYNIIVVNKESILLDLEIDTDAGQTSILQFKNPKTAAFIQMLEKNRLQTSGV